MLKIFYALSILLLVSCESYSTDQKTMLQRPFHAVDATEVIVLPTNFAFEIELPSNPSTGYDWNFVIAASDVIRHNSYRYIKDSSRRLGVPGISVWSFETLERGNTKIYFSYEPVDAKGSRSTRQVTFEIQVK